ncbi:MAG: N-acetylmuramoyl-L-alanine amidase [Clostridiales bacterium]|nr:N-acetylmuramoyl-L-alanine amidase [Candidatus Crickella equi]
MRVIYNRRFLTFIATILSVMLAISLLTVQPVDAKTKVKTPTKVTGLKVAECPMADMNVLAASLTLKWDKVKYAKKYEVNYKTGANAWTKATSKKTKLKIEGLNPYCKYSIRVRALNGSKKGNWSKTIQQYTKPYSFDVDLPDLTKALKVKNRGLGSITVAWSFNDPTDSEMTDYKRARFNVYCSVDQENWVLVAENLTTATKEYTQRSCDQNVTYYFKVVPFDRTSYKTFEVKGNESNVVSAEVRKIPGLVIEQHYTTANDEYIFNRSFNLRGLMLHSVGGNIESAEEWVNLYNTTMKSAASVHGFIDGVTGALWQTLGWEVRAGHAEAEGNNRYIGIEMCESKYLQYGKDGVTFTVKEGHEQDAKAVAQRTYQTAVKLFATLCDYYGLNPMKKGNIVSHYEWGTEYYDLSGGGHQDPEHMWRQLKTGYTMDKFRSDVKSTMNQYCY